MGRLRIKREEKKENSRKRVGRRYRFRGEYRIPNDPRIDRDLWGATVALRLDDPDYETAKFSWAENLPAIPPGDEDWENLFDARNPTENLNNRLKETFAGTRRRAPAVGARNNHFDLLCLAIYTNYVAAVTHAERLKHPLAA